MKKSLFLILFFFYSFNADCQDSIFIHLTAIQSDSLIKANDLNPNFIILDVRTPGEYIPQHLEGAINRNYYVDFDAELDNLDKKKKYLIHCASGNRSGGAFNKMKAKKFKEVYNMQGGINAWKSISLPTTTEFAPRIMLVSDSIIPLDTINIGNNDTIQITLTNRANDTLNFNSLSSLNGTEFYSDFDIDTTLLGAEDYTFNIIYTPIDEIEDSLNFAIESNAGTIDVIILRTGLDISPILTLDTDTIIEFGEVERDKIDSFPVFISNTGLSDLNFTNLSYNSSQFFMSFDLDTILSSGNSYEFFVYFSPLVYGEDSITVSIESTGGNIQFLLRGKGIYPISTNDNTIPEITIYPNPAINYFLVEGIKSKGATIKIINSNGQIVYQKQLLNNYINTSNFNKGIYFVKIYDNKSIVTKRIVIE